MFDSHCHLHDARVTDAKAELGRARAVGVRGFLLAGVDPSSFAAEDALARGNDDVAISLGVHPQVIAEVDETVMDAMLLRLRARLADPAALRAVAIGETGLDGAATRRGSLERQERAFRAQLALARDYDLPVVLHILRAHGRALEILGEGLLPEAGGVVHSYSGDPALVARYVELGLCLSFAGGVTRMAGRRAREAVALVPADRLLVETDAPDQVPETHRPAQNEPAFLPAIIDAVAALRGAKPAEIAALTERNARRLFRLD